MCPWRFAPHEAVLDTQEIPVLQNDDSKVNCVSFKQVKRELVGSASTSVGHAQIQCSKLDCGRKTVCHEIAEVGRSDWQRIVCRRSVGKLDNMQVTFHLRDIEFARGTVWTSINNHESNSINDKTQPQPTTHNHNNNNTTTTTQQQQQPTTTNNNQQQPTTNNNNNTHTTIHTTTHTNNTRNTQQHTTTHTNNNTQHTTTHTQHKTTIQSGEAPF